MNRFKNSTFKARDIRIFLQNSIFNKQTQRSTAYVNNSYLPAATIVSQTIDANIDIYHTLSLSPQLTNISKKDFRDSWEVIQSERKREEEIQSDKPVVLKMNNTKGKQNQFCSRTVTYSQ
jgi:hypothetical protein